MGGRIYRVAFDRPRPSPPALCCGCGSDEASAEYRADAGGRVMPICEDCQALQESAMSARQRVSQVKAKVKRIGLVAGIIGGVVAAAVAPSALPRAEVAGILFIAVTVGLLARAVTRWVAFSRIESVDARRRLKRAISASGGPPVVYCGSADDGEEYLFKCEHFARAIADKNGVRCRAVGQQ